MRFAEYVADPRHYRWADPDRGLMFIVTPFERIMVSRTCWALAMLGRSLDRIEWEWPA